MRTSANFNAKPPNRGKWASFWTHGLIVVALLSIQKKKKEKIIEIYFLYF